MSNANGWLFVIAIVVISIGAGVIFGIGIAWLAQRNADVIIKRDRYWPRDGE